MASLVAKIKGLPLWRDMTAKSACVAMVSCTGAAVYGYDASWWSSVLGAAFTKRYGKNNAATDTYSISAPLQSAGSAVPTAGLVIGAMLCFAISDRIGRLRAMIATSIMYLVAIIIEVTSNSYAQIVVRRFLNSIPQGMSASLLPPLTVRVCSGLVPWRPCWSVHMGA
jgi:MFS family permease